jgi:hypothetical protein
MALLVGLEASARTETLRWSHPDAASVDGYRVYYGSASRAYSWHVDVGTPSTDSEGAFVYDLEVDDTATVYVAVKAYAGSLESPYSNERVRIPSEDPGPGDPGDGGGSDGGSTPPQANAAIDHFVLWNAETDTVIDSNFTSGEQISLVEHGCTAIEVIGNSYLSPAGSAGSLQFDLDGQTPSTCSDAGFTHENEPPYAWELEYGPGQFECSASLTEVGSHTLTVTPYDGDDCSGAAGTPVTLSFDVIGSGGTPPASETLGTPGRPTLILP